MVYGGRVLSRLRGHALGRTDNIQKNTGIIFEDGLGE